jgi:hypothetical protein
VGPLVVALPLLVLLSMGCSPARPPLPRAQPSHADLTRYPALPRAAGAATFQLAEVQERRFSTEYTLTNQTQILKVEAIAGVGRADAERLAADGVMGVQALYANALSPYPGDISREVISDARFRPQVMHTNWHRQSRSYIVLFANERLGYGATTIEAARYHSLIGWFYCESGEVLYKVRIFSPAATRREELEQFFLALECPR